MPLAPKTKLSHYEIIGQLGRGGMGEVYLAYDAKLRRRVALKFLADGGEGPAPVGRFLEEARAASGLNHPNIITVHEIVESGAGQFLVMEFVEGKTVRALIDEKSPTDQALPVLRQSAIALSAAHEAKIAHLDIKPENIMVRPDGHVKLLDFGMARPLAFSDEDAETMNLTQDESGALAGTLRYMSPEQLLGESVGSPSDIFSLGIVFYETTTGQHPFRADSLPATLNAITAGSPPPPGGLNPELPQDLEDLILRMLDRDPALRPTATEVAEAAVAWGAPDPVRRPRAAVRPRTVSVGREREKSELARLHSEVIAGRGTFIGVSGEAGAGKTTLVEDFLSDLAAADINVLIGRGRCSERLESTGAYLPLLEALESLVRTGPSVERIVRLSAPTWYREIRMQHAEEVPDAGARRATSLEQLKRELAALVREVTRVGRLVLFLDDLHWADLSTVELVNYVASRFDSLPVLILGTYRPADLRLSRHPFLRVKLELQTRGLYTDFELGLLSRSEVEGYLALEFPSHGFPPDFATTIHSKTEGNPLFLVNVIRHLRDRNIIANSGGEWSLVGSLSDIASELPPSVRSMIERKIDQLDEADRRLLAVASIQGPAFDVAIVSKALEMDVGEAEERLQQIESLHDLVRAVEEREFPDGSFSLRCRFAHVLYHDAVQRLLAPTRRVSYSARIADLLLEHYRKDSSSIASELAWLFESGRNFGQAAEYFLIAARKAAKLFANGEAATLAERGLAALARLPDSASRMEQELSLQVTAGIALMSLRGYADPRVEHAYKRAAAICDQIGDDGDLLPVLWGLFTFYHVRAEMDQAIVQADRLQRLADKHADPIALLQAHNAKGIALLVKGRTRAALEHLRRTADLYDASRHARSTLLVGHDPGVLCRCYAARAEWYLGYPDRALVTCTAGLRLARDLQHPYSIVFATAFVSFVEDLRRDFPSALRHAEEAIRIASEEGFPVFRALCGIVRGWSLVHLSESGEGLAEMREAVDRLRSTGTEVTRSHNMALLADALLHLREFDQCIRTVDETLEWCGSHGVHDYDPELLRLKAAALRASDAGRPSSEAAAERLLLESLRLARAEANRSWEMRTAIDLAELWRAQGRRGQARSLLERAYRSFTEGLGTSDLLRAGSLLGVSSPGMEASAGRSEA